MTYLYHITLTTGHTRRSYRSEVGPGIAETLRPLIERALTGARVPLPAGEPVCTITGGVEGRCISLSVSGPPLSGLAFPGADEDLPVPIAEVGISPRSTCAGRVWRALHDLAYRFGIDVATDRDNPPPAPWVGALLMPGIAVYPETADWLGDLERCLGWAWVDRDDA